MQDPVEILLRKDFFHGLIAASFTPTKRKFDYHDQRQSTKHIPCGVIFQKLDAAALLAKPSVQAGDFRFSFPPRKRNFAATLGIQARGAFRECWMVSSKGIYISPPLTSSIADLITLSAPSAHHAYAMGLNAVNQLYYLLMP